METKITNLKEKRINLKTSFSLIAKTFFCILILFSLFNLHGTTFAQPSNYFDTNCVPPQSAIYLAQIHQHYPNGIDWTNASHDGFQNCSIPPPGIGDTTTHQFGSRVSGQVTGIGPVIMIVAPGQTTVKMRKISQNGPLATFQTEMLALNIQGGNLPPNIRVRESPTLQSTGQTTIKDTTGGFIIHSFFDVFTEISTNSGVSWVPATGPSRVDMRRSTTSAIPTLSQWGIIILVLLLLATGLVMIGKKQLAVAGVGGVETTKYFPFDKKIYIRALTVSLILALIYLGGMWFNNSLTITDMFGAFVSSFILAYIIHLFIAKRKEN